MKKLTVILFAFLALCSCSKEEQDIPKIPSYVDGYYKLVRVDAPYIADLNGDGVYDDFLSEYTTGDNFVDLNRQSNLLLCGRIDDSDGNEKYTFIFRVPGPYEIREITDPYFIKNNWRSWDLMCSVYLPKAVSNDRTFGFKLDGSSSGSDFGSVKRIEYRNNLLIMRVTSIYYNQQKGFVEPITLKLIFKYLASEQDEALKVSPATKFEKGDISEEYIKQFIW
ncbi:hypothetical protein K4L44_10560 [Halosquirtibacter laminarini]|uniref:Uncharacterized protein n=1 Tax=Halosquirtibacter laminarini TaxID=3374600 RepID=A0AC61NC20_9BACT|nr:hypothetical protein K4L44_10560 [Prolixibacteraceae bacterium]